MASQPSIGPTEILLGTASRPIFPFVLIKFDQTEEKDESYMVTMKVRPEIYNYIISVYAKNEVVLYLDPLSGKIEAYTNSMHGSFDILNRLGLMEPVRVWIQKAREYLAKIVSALRPPQ